MEDFCNKLLEFSTRYLLSDVFSNTVIWKSTIKEATKLLLKFALSSALLILGRDGLVLPSDVNTGGMLTILPS